MITDNRYFSTGCSITDARRKAIVADFDGSNQRELSVRYATSQQEVYRTLRKAGLGRPIEELIADIDSDDR